jgi:signal transduction histidine kinase
MHELTSLHITIDIEDNEPDLEDALKVTTFRIVQESLNNIIKHSHATQARIKIDYGQKEVRILVRDNGTGFNMDTVKNRIGRVSLGLAGMQERAMLMGGEVQIHSHPGRGTDVEAVIPYIHAGLHMEQ